MLRTPKLKDHPMYAEHPEYKPIVLEPGYLGGDTNMQYLFEDGEMLENYPNLYESDQEHDEALEYPGNNDFFNCYGVCDTPEQFIAKFGDRLKASPLTYCVGFSLIEKDPENRGKGGGWRWHKWGPYIGTGSPQCEHLDDEEGFDRGVVVYHVRQITPAESA